MPILVREPEVYVRSELEALRRTAEDGRRRQDVLGHVAREAGLPGASLDRHRDIVAAEIARAQALLALLEPSARALGDGAAKSPGARTAGWTVDALLPYLLRDWTGTSELEAIGERVGAALQRAFPDPSGRSLVLAACGAGGLLAEIAPGFGRTLGFDLTLPVLGAARHLLDGNRLDLAMPRAIHPEARITLRHPGRTGGPRVELAAMDALHTAFADGSVDCVVTSFLVDLIPEPLRLAAEIHRILGEGGIWINYGPSGPLAGLWRFDQTETAAFLEAAGFSVFGADAYRATYLDLTRDCPAWSYQSHVCYLTSARKTGPARPGPAVQTPHPGALAQTVPLHFPGAHFIARQSLGAERRRTRIYRWEATPGRAKSLEIGEDDVQILELVDGNRTVHEIAGLLERETPSYPAQATVEAFSGYFDQGLLSWRGA